MSSGRKSCISSALTSTTSPGVKRPFDQPQTVNAIAPAIIALVISDWPMLSQASEVSLRHRGAGEGMDRLVVALGLALLGAEIFDRLVVEQAVDGAADRPVVDLVHVALQPRAPVGHVAGEGDVGGDRRQRRGDQPGAELDEEDHADGGQLDQRRADVEQQEIEHHVDALGAALDDLGQRRRCAARGGSAATGGGCGGTPGRQAGARRSARPFRTRRCANCRTARRRTARPHRRGRGRRSPRRRPSPRSCGRSPPCRRTASPAPPPCRREPTAPRRPPALSAPVRRPATASAGIAAACCKPPLGFASTCSAGAIGPR